jgi:hypothetical protein
MFHSQFSLQAASPEIYGCTLVQTKKKELNSERNGGRTEDRDEEGER